MTEEAAWGRNEDGSPRTFTDLTCDEKREVMDIISGTFRLSDIDGPNTPFMRVLCGLLEIPVITFTVH